MLSEAAKVSASEVCWHAIAAGWAQRLRGNLILFKPGRPDLHCCLHTQPQDALQLPCHSHATLLSGKKEGKWQLLGGAEGTGQKQAAHLLAEEPKQ